MKDKVASAYMPIGRILLKQECLKIPQLAQLVQLQLEEPLAHLGELAVREGYCTPESLKECLRYQRENCPHILDLACQESGVDQADLMLHTAAYIRRLEHVLASTIDRLEQVGSPV